MPDSPGLIPNPTVSGPPKKGTKEYALQIIRIAKLLHRQHKQEMEKDERYYRLEFDKVMVASDTKIVKPPTARVAILTFANAMTQDLPEMTVHARSEEDKAIKDAEQNSNFLEQFWAFHQSGRNRSVLRDLSFFGLLRGPFVGKITLDEDLIKSAPQAPSRPSLPQPESVAGMVPQADLQNIILAHENYAADYASFQKQKQAYDQKSANRLAIRADARDPYYVYWDPSEYPEWVCEIYPRYWFEVERKWGKQLRQKSFFRSSGPNGEPVETVWWCEIWTEDSCWYGISNSGEDGFVDLQGWKKHSYGFIPYKITGSYTTPLSKIEDQYPSIFSGFHDLLDYEYRLFNQLAEYARKFAHAVVVAEVNDYDTVERAYKVGSIIHLIPGGDEKFYYAEPPGGGLQLLENAWEIVEGMLSRFLLTPDVLLGRQRSRSGYGTQVQAQLAAQSIQPHTNGMALCLQGMNEMILRLVEKLPGRFYVWGPNNDYGAAWASADTIKGFYRNDVNVNLRLPSEKGQTSMVEINLWKAGFQSRYTAAKNSGVRNPKREFERWAAEKVVEQLIPSIGQAAANRLGMLPPPPQGAQPEPGGAPGMPGMPMPGMDNQGMPMQAGPGSPQEAMMMQRQATRPNQAAPRQNTMRRPRAPLV